MIKNLISIHVKWIFVMVSTFTMLYAQPKGKIYCIGQGFTTGSAMFMPEKNSYPAQLAAMLGGMDKVLLNGETPMLNKGIVNGKDVFNNFNELVVGRGDVVFLDLNGGVDFAKEGRGKGVSFESKIKAWKQIGARVVLLVGPSGDNETSLANEKQQIQDAAYVNKVEIIDFTPFLSIDNVCLNEDLQLTSIGASHVARRLYELLFTPTVEVPKIKVDKETLANFYGYACSSFDFEGKEAKVVRPKKSAKGNPWVWRARFWGHEPQLDIALLERGYHIVYCDVSERFGNKEAMDIWNRFYQLLQRSGLHKKSIMEGMSRGGVYIYNWALRYPDRVSAIYADAPVLNFKSWPGGKGKGKGSLENWEVFKKAYGLTEQQALEFSDAPIDKASEIGTLNIPAIHVVGDVDDVVPPDENTIPFAKAYHAAGGKLEIIHKPTVGHHPHSLVNPSPLVDFVLRAEGRKLNFAAIAAAGSEYRPGAGWSPNKGWWGEYDDVNRILVSNKKGLDILFVGNSITQGIGGTRANLPNKPGYSAFQSLFSAYEWDCAGIAGDRTQNVFWRLKNGKYKEASPKIVVLTIGVNNFLDGDTSEEIAQGILEMNKWIQINMKDSRLIVTGPLPVGLKKTDPRRLKYEDIHRLLALHAKNESWIYVPLSNTFIQADGSLSLDDYSTDGIHLSGGYVKWAQALHPVISKILDK